MSGNLTSAVTILQSLTLVSYSLSWTGTSPVGTVLVQVSNDYSLNANGTVNNAGTWTTLTLSTSASVSGNTGTGFINLGTVAAYAIRLLYTATSGTGNLNVVINAKVG